MIIIIIFYSFVLNLLHLADKEHMSAGQGICSNPIFGMEGKEMKNYLYFYIFFKIVYTSNYPFLLFTVKTDRVLKQA